MSQNLMFSGSAADMLKSMGAAVPDQQPQTSLEEAQAAKKKMDAEKVCTDEHCTEDHAHGHDHGDGKVCTADHGHGGHDHANHDHGGHDHATCTADHGHGGHDHASHDHGGHDHSTCTMDHDHGSHDKKEGGHDHGHGHGHEKKAEDRGHGHGHGHEKKEASGHDHGGHDHSCCGGHDHADAGEHPIVTKLKAALDATHVAVEDLSDGCGAKLKITIVSAKFEGLPLLKQHRLVNDAAKAELSAVHAFNLKTFTPAKWAAANK